MLYNVLIKEGAEWKAVVDTATGKPKQWTDKTSISPVYKKLYPLESWMVVAEATITDTFVINDPV